MTLSSRLDDSPDELLARAAEAEAAGRLIDAVDLLQRANRLRPDADVEVRLVGLRDRGFDTLTASSSRTSWPPTYPDLTPGCDGLPEIDASELTEAALGSGIVNHGALVVRDLLEADQVTAMVADIDRAFAAYDDWMADDSREAALAPWFARYRPANGYPESKLPRNYVRGSGGVWVADTPRMMFELVELFERKGLDRVIAAYLGERPAL